MRPPPRAAAWWTYPPAGAAAEEHPLHLALPGQNFTAGAESFSFTKAAKAWGSRGSSKSPEKSTQSSPEHVLPADVAQPQLAAQGHVDPAHRGQIQIGVAHRAAMPRLASW